MKYTLQNSFTLLISTLLLTYCKTTQTDLLSQNHPIEHQLDSILTALNQEGAFNGNVLVAKNGNILYQKGFGVSNGDQQTSLKTTDRFNIGSIYKEIPAIAIMQLEEKGQLNLNDPIKKHLKKLPQWANDITVLHLLQYTSGLPKINWRKHQKVNDDALMSDLLEMTKLEFTPGTSYLYTNYSPFLLSKIVEKISLKSFPSYAQQNILEPLKMNHSQYNQSFPYTNRESMAIAFNDDFEEDRPPFTIASPIFLFSTTTEDLFVLLQNLHSYKIISQKSLEVIGQTADLAVENMESPLGQVKYLNHKIIEHTHHGSSGNYECIVNKQQSNNTTIIILTNNKNQNVHSIKNTIQGLMG